MKPLLNTILLALLLVIGFSGGVNGQDATDFEETKHADQLSRQLQVAAPSMDQVDIILDLVDRYPTIWWTNLYHFYILQGIAFNEGQGK